VDKPYECFVEYEAQPKGSLSFLWDVLAGVPAAPATPQQAEKLFLPTGCMQFLQCLHQALPQHHLIAADFAHFAPSDVKILGRNAPIISHTVRSYYVPTDCFRTLMMQCVVSDCTKY
jgi:hypothetical protein